MDGGDFGDRRRTGQVKAASNVYGERILNGNFSLKKTHMDFPESSAGARELHIARRDMSQYKENRRAAETVKDQAESELSNARKTVKELSSLIEQSSAKAKERMNDIEVLRKSGRRHQRAVAGRKSDGYHYAEVMRELELVKQELSKLKLDMASVLEEKVHAEKEIEASSSRMWSNLSSVGALRKEVEAVNEEQVLVELARIEALRECGEIEAEREKEASEFSFRMDETRKKMKDVMEEMDDSEELENNLAVTLSDIKVLEDELNHVREIDKRAQRNISFKQFDDGFEGAEELQDSPLLLSIREELEAAKKELESIKEEGFQFMTSMDIIRNEKKHVTEEIARIEKTEAKTDLKVQSLNSKLLRAKSKLEAVTAAEEKAKSIATNLSVTLEQLRLEAEAARKEKSLIVEETATIKKEIERTESEIDSTEERLQAIMQKLEAVKSSEASALEKLKSLIENTVQTRSSVSQQSSTITISKFEYEYLTGRAVGAQEIADKKVAAAQAWVQALKASEKEILMKIEMANRENRQTRVEEEQLVYTTERSLSARRRVEGEMQNWRQKREKSKETGNFSTRMRRKSTKGNIKLTPVTQGKLRKAGSPAIRTTPNYFTIKKKRKVMPNLARFFSGKKQAA